MVQSRANPPHQRLSEYPGRQPPIEAIVTGSYRDTSRLAKLGVVPVGSRLQWQVERADVPIVPLASVGAHGMMVFTGCHPPRPMVARKECGKTGDDVDGEGRRFKRISGD